jgi:hypothetical protein
MRRISSLGWRVIGLMVVLVAFAAGLSFSLTAGYLQSRELCDAQRRIWTTQRLSILDDAVLLKPSPLILRALHLPPYDPKNPLYAEQIHVLNAKRDRKLSILGSRPNC